MTTKQTLMNKILGKAYKAAIQSMPRRESINRSKYTPHQGARECARRRGEIGWKAKA